MANADDKSNVTPINKRREMDGKAKKLIVSSCQEIEDIKAERKGCNERLSAQFEKFEGEGYDKDAVKAAIKRASMSEEKRQRFDNTYIAVSISLGALVQQDMFAANFSEILNPPQPPESDESKMKKVK